MAIGDYRFTTAVEVIFLLISGADEIITVLVMVVAASIDLMDNL